ncbi:acyl carrier protein [Candidatus Omnitrophota bacterium]
MSEEAITKVKEIIQETIGVKQDEIQDDGKLYDSLSVDSTEMVEITVALEKAFGIKLDKEQCNKFSSVNDIVSAITAQQSA